MHAIAFEPAVAVRALLHLVYSSFQVLCPGFYGSAPQDRRRRDWPLVSDTSMACKSMGGAAITGRSLDTGLWGRGQYIDRSLQLPWGSIVHNAPVAPSRRLTISTVTETGRLDGHKTAHVALRDRYSCIDMLPRSCTKCKLI